MWHRLFELAYHCELGGELLEIGRWTSAARLSATCMCAVVVAPMTRVSIEKFTFLVCNSDVEKGLSLSVKMKVSSPKTLMNALAAETALVLDELEAELIFFQQIQGVRKTKTDTW